MQALAITGHHMLPGRKTELEQRGSLEWTLGN